MLLPVVNSNERRRGLPGARPRVLHMRTACGHTMSLNTDFLAPKWTTRFILFTQR